jgi:adenylate cyclase
MLWCVRIWFRLRVGFCRTREFNCDASSGWVLHVKMTARGRRALILAVVAFAVTAATLVLFLIPVVPVLRLELLSQDLRAQLGRKTPINTNLVFIGVDQPGYGGMFSEDEVREAGVLAKMDEWPFPRDVYADLIDRLCAAGARVVALDFVFSGEKPGDAALTRSLALHSNRVVLAANVAGAQGGVLMVPEGKLLGSGNPRNDPRVAFINVWPDRDGVVRSARFKVGSKDNIALAPGEEMQSLAAAMLQSAGNDRHVPQDSALRVIRFSAPPGKGYPVIPIYSPFLKNHWENNFGSGAFFRDKLVLVGPAANIMQDFHLVPLADVRVDEEARERVSNQSMLGPEIHLNIVAAAAAGELLKEMPARTSAQITALCGIFGWLLSLLIRQPFRRLLLSAVLAAAFCVLAQMLFDHGGYVIALVSPFLAFSGTTLVTFAYDFVLERREKNRTRRTLERYVSKDVVREILDNPDTFLNSLGGVRRPVTVLFSDVRGFTTMTEGADPAQLVMQLNEYFNEMVAIVFAEKGVLDKFIGDAVMAVWGSIERTSQGVELDAQHAVAAALAMRKSLARLNINWKQRGLPELAFGIGVNHGEVIVGNLGSDQKMEMSVIGDAVNLGSRLESLTKEYKLDLLLGEAMAPLVQSRFVLRSVDSVQVKGKRKPVHVYTVIADKEAGEEVAPWLMRYEEGITCYRSRRFVEGLDAFADCVREQPEDHLSQLYLRRCQELVTNPPGPDWDTVFVMKSK